MYSSYRGATDLEVNNEICFVLFICYSVHKKHITIHYTFVCSFQQAMDLVVTCEGVFTGQSETPPISMYGLYPWLHPQPEVLIILFSSIKTLLTRIYLKFFLKRCSVVCLGTCDPCNPSTLGVYPYTKLRILPSCIWLNCYVYTVEPLLKDSPNKGHHRNTSLQSSHKNSFSTSANTFFTSEEWTTSLQWTNYLVPICPL